MAKACAEHIRDQGAGKNHQCLMIHPTNASPEGIEGPLREAFAEVIDHPYAATLDGWPWGPNEMFGEACIQIAKDARFGDFLWFETDCALKHQHSLDMIDGQYRTCGQPFLGVSVDTVQMDTKQVVGRHVVGVAVYPKLFATVCPLIRAMKRMSAEYKAKNNTMCPAFDAWIGPYMIGRTAETRLIQHFWRSGEFRQENGQIIAGKTISPNVERIVSPDAVLIHGCKDTSLFRIFSPYAPIAEIDSSDRKKEAMTLKAIDETLRKPAVSVAAPAAKSIEVPKEGSTQIPYMKRGQKPVPVPPELWNRGEDGLPVPPFLLSQKEFDRWRQLMTERLSKHDGFKRLRDYAKKNLKINTLRMTAERICDACVLEERKRGKEAWTKDLPGPWFPPVVEESKPEPVHPPPEPIVPTIPQYSTAEPITGPDFISESMKAKMLELRKKREAAAVTA